MTQPFLGKKHCISQTDAKHKNANDIPCTIDIHNVSTLTHQHIPYKTSTVKILSLQKGNALTDVSIVSCMVHLCSLTMSGIHSLTDLSPIENCITLHTPHFDKHTH